MLAIVVEQPINTGQFLACLFATFLPHLIIALLHAVVPSDPKPHAFLISAFVRQTPCHLREIGGSFHRTRCKKKKKFCKMRRWTQDNAPTTTKLLQTYLLATAITTYWVDCLVKCALIILHHPCLQHTVHRVIALAATKPHQHELI